MNQLHVLIVEDSISYGIELEQLCNEIGYHVQGNVDNSADALDTIFSNSPDLILMDINIKGKLSGIDLAQKIKHLDIPILYITSHDDVETYEEALKSNLAGYIVKPVSKYTLMTSLKLLLQNQLNKNVLPPPGSIKSSLQKDFLYIMKDHVYQKVKISNIDFVKSEDNYCRFTFNDGSNSLVRITMNEMVKLLENKSFIRCHRQFVINTLSIDQINVNVNNLTIGHNIIPFSRSKKKELLSISNFLK